MAEKKWIDVINEIQEKIFTDQVDDVRPFAPPYSDPVVEKNEFDHAFLVYMKDGTKMIYLFEKGNDNDA